LASVTGSPRREQLLAILEEAQRPISGHELADRLGVSRQVVVQDFALLRASGHDVLATPRGYVLPHRDAAVRAVLATRHDRNHTEEELTIMVDHGLKVLDVIVEHAVYGELRGSLMMTSRDDVREFAQRIEAGERDPALLEKELYRDLGAIPGSRVDYAQCVSAETLGPLPRLQGPVLIAIAVFLGSTRLIDNFQITA